MPRKMTSPRPKCESRDCYINKSMWFYHKDDFALTPVSFNPKYRIQK